MSDNHRYCAQCGEAMPVVDGKAYCDSCIQSLISDTCSVDDLETENINLRRQNAKLEAALRGCSYLINNIAIWLNQTSRNFHCIKCGMRVNCEESHSVNCQVGKMLKTIKRVLK